MRINTIVLPWCAEIEHLGWQPTVQVGSPKLLRQAHVAYMPSHTHTKTKHIISAEHFTKVIVAQFGSDKKEQKIHNCHLGQRAVIAATSTLSCKTSLRVVRLQMHTTGSYEARLAGVIRVRSASLCPYLCACNDVTALLR